MERIIIEVSKAILEALNPSVYTVVTPSNDSEFYIESIKLQVAKERTHLGKNWFESHRLLQENGKRMPTLPEFVEILKYTKNNNQDIYDGITKVESPWRAEWIDADFKQKDGNLCINSKHIYQGENLVHQESKHLQKNTLMEDRDPGISLDSWINSPTKQGLPSKKTGSGNLYYWAPMSDNNSVAWFCAGSGRAGLYCDGDPSGSDSNLGVRAVRSVN